MSRRQHLRDISELSVASLVCGITLQLLSASIIYIHGLSYTLSGTQVPQTELVITFLYLFIIGTGVHIFGLFSIYNHDRISTETVNPRHLRPLPAKSS